MNVNTRTKKRALGVYYTPALLVRYLVSRTVGRSLLGRFQGPPPILRILDPACGDGGFLVHAYRYLLAWHRRRGPLSADQRRQILRDCIFGVDIDPGAVALTRRALLAELDGEPCDLEANIRHGNALIGPDFLPWNGAALDWSTAFPDAIQAGGFDVVLANPPWGQKEIHADDQTKRYLQARFPSSVGIFDWFRPFVELAVTLTRPGGQIGLVLPDIVLLKNYQPTRRLLLDQLRLKAIDWWGRAFGGAMIDAVTIVGHKKPDGDGQRVRVCLRENGRTRCHAIPQAEFRANPRCAFNLHLTPDRRRVLERLADCPRLGDFFEIHEGVHSGNMRAELFVNDRQDTSCRELLFGRDEIEPYRLHWRGRFVRLAAMTEKRQGQYASLGRPEWFDRDKLLVRRTGDHVLAAVDRCRRYASNNFFVVLGKRPCALDLDGLCAVLNSRFMTWYFRTVEPRRGRAFAELKIKHLRAFPLPTAAEADGCRSLNELGNRRSRGEPLDPAIDRLVLRLFGVAEKELAE